MMFVTNQNKHAFNVIHTIVKINLHISGSMAAGAAGQGQSSLSILSGSFSSLGFPSGNMLILIGSDVRLSPGEEARRTLTTRFTDAGGQDIHLQLCTFTSILVKHESCLSVHVFLSH